MPKKEITPVNRDKSEAKKFYDKISFWYDHLIDKFEKKYRRQGINVLDVKAGDRVLEIGFGTGDSILRLAKKVGNTGKVYGVDISTKMYELTLKKVKEEGLEERVELFNCDGVTFNYEANYFTKVFLSFTLELFSSDEIKEVLQNAFKMLTKQGEIGIVSLSRHHRNLPVKIYEKLHQKFPVYIDCRPIYVNESLEEAGFQIKREKTFSMWGLPVKAVVGQKKV